MFNKLLRSSAFQSLLSKILIVYIVYIKEISLLRLFAFTSNMSEAAILTADIAIFAFIIDTVIMCFIKQYITVTIAFKNTKTRENSTFFYRDGSDIERVVLIVSVTSKGNSTMVLKMLKRIIKGDRVLGKLKWSHDSWLSFQRIDGLLNMDESDHFYTGTDGLYFDIFGAVSEEENYAEIINTPLLMSCDMGDKGEGLITFDEIVKTNNKFKKKLIEILVSIWVEFIYVEHKVKVI